MGFFLFLFLFFKEENMCGLLNMIMELVVNV